jgi:hypothetical protein
MSDLAQASAVAGILVLISKLHQAGAVSEQEKGRLKDCVLAEDNDVLCAAFVQFVSDGNKEKLVHALLACLNDDDDDDDDGTCECDPLCVG